MKSILFTNHHLVHYAGSELVTLDLCKHFKESGWDVEVATFVAGEPILKHFRAQGIKVNNLLQDSTIEKRFDLIWVHHHPVITKYLTEEKQFASTIILSCLSPYEPLEAPPLFANDLSLVLANSGETQEELVRCGIKDEKICLFPNSISDAWFLKAADGHRRKKQRLSRVAVVSNHPPDEVTQLATVKGPITFDFIGLPGKYKLVTPEVLRDFDAVLTIGRTVQQALALRIPVFCYDKFGGPGWLTETNFDGAERFNFSGRCTRRTITTQELLDDLVNGFPGAVTFSAKAFDLCLERYSLKRNVEIVLKRVSKSNQISKHRLNPAALHLIKRINETYITSVRAICGLETKLQQEAEQSSQQGARQDNLIQELRLRLKEQDSEIHQRDEVASDLRTKIASLQGKAEGIEQEREMLGEVINRQSQQMSVLTDEVKLILTRKQEVVKMLGASTNERDELRRMLVDANHERDHLVRQNEDIYTTLYDLQSTLALMQQRPVDDKNGRRGDETNKSASYRELISRIRGLVRHSVPRDATMIIASKGDNELLKLHGRKAWHFPQVEGGVYAGHHPANSAAAIAQLEMLRLKGANYFILPTSMLWWLEHYAEFARYLERHYPVTVRQEETCLIFHLERRVSQTGWKEQLTEIFDDGHTQPDQGPSILDWNCGLNLAGNFPQFAIFSPPTNDALLPYMDGTVDIVVTSGSDVVSLAEGHRVAKRAVIRVSHAQKESVSHVGLEIDSQPDINKPADTLSTSIVVSCHNDAAETEICLQVLTETLPRNFKGEIIVVDDASTDETANLLNRLARLDQRIKVLRARKRIGVLAGFNRPAKAATGDILVFLGGRSLLMAGWLKPLLRAFRDCPKIGIVGGKHISADGRLREAGGIVFANGRVRSFGESDFQIESPLYNFVREVDFCSPSL